MSYKNRIENLILQAYIKGRTHLTTQLLIEESLNDEVEITTFNKELKAQGFRVHYDDVFRELRIDLPKISFVERCRRIAYDETTILFTWIKDISESILVDAQYGKHSKRVTLRRLAIEGLEQKLADHFREEGFEVEVEKLEDEDTYNLHISWKFKNVGE